MTGPEPRTFRNWHAIIDCAVCMVGFGLGSLSHPLLGLVAVPFTVPLVIAARQHVIVLGAEVELHKGFRQHRIALAEVDRLTVSYSLMGRGWRLRLHLGSESIDTFIFLNLTGFRVSEGTFTAPPADAPASVKELYALLSARMVPGSREELTA